MQLTCRPQEPSKTKTAPAGEPGPFELLRVSDVLSALRLANGRDRLDVVAVRAVLELRDHLDRQAALARSQLQVAELLEHLADLHLARRAGDLHVEVRQRDAQAELLLQVCRDIEADQERECTRGLD